MIIETPKVCAVDSIPRTIIFSGKQDEFKKQAREQAIKEAKTKAQDLALQLGVNLVRITNFSESGAIPRYYGLEKAVGMGIGEEELQIETGENKIEVTVNITFEIN